MHSYGQQITQVVQGLWDLDITLNRIDEASFYKKTEARIKEWIDDRYEVDEYKANAAEGTSAELKKLRRDLRVAIDYGAPTIKEADRALKLDTVLGNLCHELDMYVIRKRKTLEQSAAE